MTLVVFKNSKPTPDPFRAGNVRHRRSMLKFVKGGKVEEVKK
jgi:hypothetical protein